MTGVETAIRFPACGEWTACVYRCEECGHDLVDDSDGTAGRIGGNR